MVTNGCKKGEGNKLDEIKLFILLFSLFVTYKNRKELNFLDI